MKLNIRIDEDFHEEVRKLWRDLRWLRADREGSGIHSLQADRNSPPNRFLLLGSSEAILEAIVEASSNFMGIPLRVANQKELLKDPDKSPHSWLISVFDEVESHERDEIIFFPRVEHLLSVPADQGNINLFPLFVELLDECQPVTAIFISTVVPQKLPKKLAELCDRILNLDIDLNNFTDNQLANIFSREIPVLEYCRYLPRKLLEAVPGATLFEIVRGLQLYISGRNRDASIAESELLEHVEEIAESIRQQKKLLDKFDQASSEFLNKPN